MNRLRSLYREWRFDCRVRWVVRETRRLQAKRLKAPFYVWMTGGYPLWLAGIERTIRELDDELAVLSGDDEEDAPEGVTVH